MNDYELTVLVKASLGDKDLDKEVKSLHTLLEKAGAKIKSKKDPEKKQMTYEIEKSREAYYVFVEMSLPPSEVAGIDQKLKVNDNVIRYLFIRKDL